MSVAMVEAVLDTVIIVIGAIGGILLIMAVIAMSRGGSYNKEH
jgi:hypothetical protein